MAFYLEHVMSNAIIPSMIYNAYLLYEYLVNVDEAEDDNALKRLIAWIAINPLFYALQSGAGTEAIYYLKVDEENDDAWLWPSLFYILNWVDHSSRSECAEYTYAY